MPSSEPSESPSYGFESNAPLLSGEAALSKIFIISKILGFNHPKALIIVLRYGRGAGPRRNRQMLDENPDISLVLAFHEDLGRSKGTRDMVRRSEKKGIRTKIITG